MRRSNKFVMLITAFVFVISFMATNFAFGTTMKTHAATNSFDNLVVPAKATMGQVITLPSPASTNSIEVTNPNGDKVSLDGTTTFTAAMAGYYNVDYYFIDGTFYKGLRIFVKAENPEFVIPFGGADIPTYVKKGTAFNIPVVTLAVYKADGTVDEDATKSVNQVFTITYKVMKPDGSEDTLSASGGYCTFTPALAGSYFVRYIAKSANQTISKDFTVKVQEDFEDKDKPELTAPNVPSDVNQKSKVTLPIATATDNFDANVKIAITVTDKDNKPVKGYNDDDPKNVTAKEEDAIFDNSRNMSFYTFSGETYSVKYSATDDNGNTMDVVYPITVADRQSPVFDMEENIVPSKWGKIVKYGDSDNPTELTDSKIKFPAPYAYDNVTAESNLTYTFTLKNPSGINFYVATIKGGTVTTDPNYSNASVSPSRTSGMSKTDYFAFDVNTYNISSQTLGEYVATYTVRDEKNNSKTVSYNVNVAGVYEDYTMPELEFKNIPDFIFVDDEFVPQSISAYDKEDTTTVYLDVVYNYRADNGTTRNDFFDEDDSITFEFAGVITINVTAKDKVGNTVTEKIEVQVIDPTIVKRAPDIDYAVSAENLEGGKNIANLDNGGKFSLSSLKIDGDLDNYMGCEIIVRAPAKNNAKTTINNIDYYGTGVIVSTTSEFVRTDKGASTIDYKSFSFKATQIGTYSLTIRAFDVAGCSSFTTILIDVSGSEFPYTPAETLSVNTTVPSTLQLNEAFALPKYTAQEGYQILTAITGPQYELKGNIFTPKANGSYKISFSNYNSTTGVTSPPKTFDVTVTDTATPTFTLLEEYSSYVKKWDEKTDEQLTGAERYSKMAKVPAISVTSITGVTSLEVIVRDKLSEVVKTEKYNGSEYFKPVKDGRYTITYTVKTLSNTATYDITMFAGDLVQPTWKATIVEPAKSYKIDDEFTFSDISAQDETSTENNITYYKKLIGPDKSELYSDTSSVTTKKFTFTKAGIYKVIYEATDEAGNTAIKEFTISVTGKDTSDINYKLLTTVLIIIVVILIISVGAYMMFFRKQKERA